MPLEAHLFLRVQYLVDLMKDHDPTRNMGHLVAKHWEKYPSDLSEEEVQGILADSYKHRSCFVHRGEQPPHREPVAYSRFFQEFCEYDGIRLIEKILPNYELLVGVAQRSIRGSAETK